MNTDELGREAAHIGAAGLGAVESGATETFRFMAAAVSPSWSGRLKVALSLLAIMLITAGGVWLGYKLTPRPVPEVIAAAPEVKQADGSIELARKPDAHPAPPPHIIPRGFHEERREQFTVAPAPGAAASGCPAVRVSLSVVSDDHQHRVIASSPDGRIVDAVDIAIKPALMPPAPLPWAAGLSYDTRHAVGVWLDRDVGRLVVGAAVARLPDGKTEAQLRVGVRF